MNVIYHRIDFDLFSVKVKLNLKLTKLLPLKQIRLYLKDVRLQITQKRI
jgi:hypothetical protein